MNPDKLGAIVRKIASDNEVPHQSVYDMFFFERFLYRLSKSRYRERFVLKGGFLLQATLGISRRTTMDLDLKAIGIELDDDSLAAIIGEICAIPSDDEVSFRLLGISEIAAETKYGGKSVKIRATMKHLWKVFSIDIAKGDVVTPHPLEYFYGSMLDEPPFPLLAYSKETILAEKFEALLSRGMQNSRAKDLLDIHNLLKDGVDGERLNAAIINTFHARGTPLDKEGAKAFLAAVLDSGFRREVFESYARKHGFAKGVTFDEVMESCFGLLKMVSSFPKITPKEGTHITLIRHGEDEQDKVGGWSDNALTPRGVLQVSSLAETLDHDYDFIISSDLSRCRQSAEIVGSRINCPIIYMEGLREMNNGDYRNLTREEFERRGCKRFVDMRMDECYPGGESPTSFFERVKETYMSILSKWEGKKIAVVTHEGVITCIECLSKGYRYSNLLMIAPHHAEAIDIPSEASIPA